MQCRPLSTSHPTLFPCCLTTPVSDPTRWLMLLLDPSLPMCALPVPALSHIHTLTSGHRLVLYHVLCV